jgi:hypothetical protein
MILVPALKDLSSLRVACTHRSRKYNAEKSD